jgi:small basic protein
VVGEQAPDAVVLEAAVLNANVVAVVEAQAGALRARERQIADQQVTGTSYFKRIALTIARLERGE